jgi:hypothetical protein
VRDLGFSDAADEVRQQPMKSENAESVITGADPALLCSEERKRRF